MKSIRFWMIAVIVFFSGLQAMLWLGDSGVVSVLQLQKRIDDLARENQSIGERLSTIQAETDAIKQHPEALEGLAREHLGMIHQDDTWYWLITSTASQSLAIEP